MQIVGPPRPVPLTRVDLRELPPEAREAEASRLIVRESRRPFDLSRDLMLRATLVRLDDEEHVLLLVMHHIASDGQSLKVLFGELSALYNALRAGRRANLPELPVQYVDYVVWQWQRLQDGELQRLMDYWKDQPGRARGTAHARRPAVSMAVGNVEGRSARAANAAWLLQELLRAVSPAKRHAVHDAAGYLGDVAASLLWRRGHPDWHVHRQPQPARGGEVDRMLHHLFTSYCATISAEILHSPSYSNGCAKPRSMLSRTASCRRRYFLKSCTSCDIGFTLQTTARSSLELDGLQVERIKTDRGGNTTFLRLAMIQGDEIDGELDYNSYIFEAATIQRMLGDLQSLLEGSWPIPNSESRGLPLLTEAGGPVHPAQARSWSIRFRKRLRWSLRHARRGAGRLSSSWTGLAAGGKSIHANRTGFDAYCPRW